MPDSTVFSFSPIGIIHTHFKSPAGTPIQGALATDNEGEVELWPQYARGLADLAGFERIVLIYVFDRSRRYELSVVPYLDSRRRGLFATRAPRRPNPIGITVVKLLAVEGNRLAVAGLDMLDETPLLDIKPYIPAIEAFPDSKTGWIEDKMGRRGGKLEETPLADGRFHESREEQEAGEDKSLRLHCAICKKKECYQGKDCPQLSEESKALIRKPPTYKMMHEAASIESTGYGRLTRLEELIAFSKRMEVRRMGIAFCIGLSDEAREVEGILKRHFDVNSVCCKVCGIQKDDLGLPRLYKDREFDTSCNPVAQAMVLNACETQLNVILGLCMGHDLVFARHSHSPVTALVVKDRVLGHNPVMALWSSYHRKRFSPE